MCPYGNTCLSERVHLLYSPNKLTLRHKTWVYLYNSKLKNSIKNAVNFLCLLTLFVIRHFRGICSSVHVQRKVGNPCFTPISLQTFIHFNSLFGILWRPFASSAVAVRLRIQDDICAKPVISLLNGKSSADLHIILLVKRNNFEIMFLHRNTSKLFGVPTSIDYHSVTLIVYFYVLKLARLKSMCSAYKPETSLGHASWLSTGSYLGSGSACRHPSYVLSWATVCGGGVATIAFGLGLQPDSRSAQSGLPCVFYTKFAATSASNYNGA